ncbi:hypothetical protein chiPu_0023987, partial [Chiloscyllium punctatum]|nr:hypothetical protein [Chiloscyllium punctatum]
MDSDASFENPLYIELKYFCKRVKEAYMDLKDDLIPYKDNQYYRVMNESDEGILPET